MALKKGQIIQCNCPLVTGLRLELSLHLLQLVLKNKLRKSMGVSATWI